MNYTLTDDGDLDYDDRLCDIGCPMCAQEEADLAATAFAGNDVLDVVTSDSPRQAAKLLIDLIDEGSLDRKTALLNLMQVVSIGLADYA